MNTSRIAALILTVVGCTSQYSSAAYFGSLQYMDNGASISITGCDLYVSTYVIPASIAGKPVTEIAPNAFRSSNSRQVTIPSTVTSIGAGAFYGCGFLKNIDIPSGVVTVGEHTFEYCTALTSVSMSSTVQSIGEYAFMSCRSLLTVTLPPNLVIVSKGLFSDCWKLGNVVIPSSVTAIGDFSFAGCSKLSNLLIPAKVASIGAGAFQYNQNLTEVNIPSSVISIGENAFGSSGLLYLTLNNGLKSIGESAFIGCYKLSEVVIPTSVNSIGRSAFLGTGLVDVTLSSNLETIAENVFKNCPKLAEVMIPPSVKSIEKSAFEGSGLIHVKLTSGIESIGQRAFAGCEGLAELVIPSTVKAMGDRAFLGGLFRSAIFLGNAPSMGVDVFGKSFPGREFTVFCSVGSSGFTYPKWFEYNSSGPSPEISVQLPNKEFAINDGPRTRFGTVLLGKAGRTLKFTIRNVGTESLTGLSMEKQGKGSADFVVQPLSSSFLAPGKSMTFNVVFKPTVTGKRRAKLVIKSNDSDETYFNLKLAGTGIDFFHWDVSPSSLLSSQP
jgi:hypothetical protein